MCLGDVLEAIICFVDQVKPKRQKRGAENSAPL